MSSGGGVKRAGSATPLVLLFIAMIALYGFGCFNFWILIAPWIPTIQTLIGFALPWLAGYWWAIIIFIGILAVLGFVLAYVILLLMKRAAAGVLRVVWLLQAVFMIGIGIFMFLFLGPFGFFGLIFPVIGLIQFWVWFRRRQKIYRAGKLAEFTATLLLEEREMFIVPLVTAVFSLLTFTLMAATFGALYFHFTAIGFDVESWAFFAFWLLIEACYLFIYFSVFYLFEGINVSIAHTWYREKDPVLRGALSEVRQVARTIIAFAGLTTLVSIVMSAVRRSGRKAGGIFALIGTIFARIIGAVYRFITYFTLPAIIIEKRGLKDSVKRSARLTWEYMVDVYIKETGVNTVFSLFGAILSLGYLVVGFVFGYILSVILIGDLGFALIAGIAFAIIFLIFAAIPGHFVFRPLNTAYRTFMFSYAMDEESGFALPSRLPKAYRDIIEEAQAEWEAEPTDRGMEEPPSEW